MVYHLIPKKVVMTELRWILQNFNLTLVKLRIGNPLMKANKDCCRDVRQMWHRWWWRNFVFQLAIIGNRKKIPKKMCSLMVMITRIRKRLTILIVKRKVKI